MKVWAFLLVLLLTGGVGAQEMIRIGVGQDQAQVALTILGGGRMVDGEGVPLHETEGRVGYYRVFSQGRELRVTDRENQEIGVYPSPLYFEPVDPGSDRNRWSFNAANYRGSLEVRVNPRGSLTVINHLLLEEYLYGVVPREIPASWSMEALKAQAVTARTYTYSSLGKHAIDGFDLCSTTHCQVYGGVSGEHPRTTQAVEETRGLVAMLDGRLIGTYYHSTAADHTANNEEVWSGAPQSHLRGVPNLPVGDLRRAPDDPDRYLTSLLLKPNPESYDAHAPYYRWEAVWTRREMEELLSRFMPDYVWAPGGFKLGTLKDIRIESRGPSGRVQTLTFVGSENTYQVHRDQIRWAMRYLDTNGNPQPLRSTFFSLKVWRDPISDLPAVIYIYGGGWGHGIGMSQVGAEGMARAGHTYEEILAFYYQGVTVAERQVRR